MSIPDANQSLIDACEMIKRGGVAIFPTDTFFALGANAMNVSAVRRVFELKGRQERHPLPVLISSADMVGLLAEEVPGVVDKLAEAFWPGALTIVVTKSIDVPAELTGGGRTVGVRVPDHHIALELLRTVGLPVTGTSANPSGTPPTKELRQIHQWFDGTGAAIVEASCGALDAPSTVLDLTQERPTIVRHGSVSLDALRELLPDVTANRDR